MENMKYFTFKRESNNFDDILTDNVVKKLFDTKIRWTHHLMIGIDEDGNEGSISYLTLKYGDDMIGDIVPDRSPVIFNDYQPANRTKNSNSLSQ